jgi:hypothetical protein
VTEGVMSSPNIGLVGTIHEDEMTVSEQGAEALAIIATEWFKTARRLSRLTQESAPTRLERERAQLAYSKQRIEDALATHGLRLITYDGSDFSAQLPTEPINPEDFDTEEGLIISETIEPTVLHEGKIVLRGRVVLAKGK